MTEEQLHKFFHTEKFQLKKESTPSNEPSSPNDLLKKMVDFIDVKYCDDRNDWLKIICAMKKCGFHEEDAKEWSMKSDRFTEEGFTTLWESYQESSLTCTEGTLRYYAKLSNPTEYYKMTIKKFATDPTDRVYG